MRGILRRMEQRGGIENPAIPISSANIVDALQLGSTSAAGISVTHEKTLGITAFWAGMRMISQTVAMLPCECFEQQGQSHRLAVEHGTHKLLYIRPNPAMTPFTFKELRIAHLLCWGNAYAEIEYNNAGRAIALWPLLPDRTGVEVVRAGQFYPTIIDGVNIKDGDKIYWTVVDGVRIWLAADRVLHVPGPGSDGLRGYNVIKLHRDSLGLSIATNQYGSEFFANSGRPSGFLSHPGNPNKEDRKELRESWNQIHGGLTRAQRTALMWGGMKYEALSVPPEEAQFLQTREMQIEEVARILNINPILLQHFTKATTWGTGIAQFLTAFATLTIAPWLERDEDVLNHDLFFEFERGRFYVKYNMNALLRGDPETQAKVLEIKRRNGIINGDQWAALDDENPLPGGQGKAYLVPLNMVPLDQLLNPPEPPPASEPAAAANARSKRQARSATMRERLRTAHLAAFEDGASRYVRRDVEAVRKAVKAAVETTDPVAYLNRWIDEFYPGQRNYILRTMLPLISALAMLVAAEAADEVGAEPRDTDAFAQSYTENLARREAGSSVGQIKALIEINSLDGLGAALLIRADEWTENRPGKVAANEVVRVSTGAARFAWGAAGVTYLVWRAGPNACELCRMMDGKKVGIAEYFLIPGESVTPAGKSGLVAEENLAGPPLHEKCQCTIVAEV